MQSLLLLSGLVALADQALATGAGGAVGISPAFPPNGAPALDRRNLDESCATSVFSSLSPPEPTDSAFLDWATSTNDFWTESCTITVPASFSSDYISYVSEFDTWLNTIESAAAKATDCGVDDDEVFAISLSGLCTASRTVVFVEDVSATATGDATTTILKALNIPQETIQIGAAAQQPSVAGFAVAVATFLGVALAL